MEQCRNPREDHVIKSTSPGASSSQPESLMALSSTSKRPLSNPTPLQPPRSLSGLQSLNLGNAEATEDVTMQDALDVEQEGPSKKRAALGDGISNGSGSPLRNSESSQPTPSRVRPTSLPHNSFPGATHQSTFEPRSQTAAGKQQLWTPDQDAHLSRSTIDPSNIASLQAQRTRNQGLNQSQKSRNSTRPNNLQSFQASSPSPVPTTTQSYREPHSSHGETYDMVKQPETRPISQEQLVAEVKGK